MPAPIHYTDLTATQLLEHAISREEGELCDNGALRVKTGLKTGRSPKDRYIVKGPTTKDTVQWGPINQSMDPEIFDCLWEDALISLHEHDIFEKKYHVGAHPQHHVTVTVQCNFAWHTLFCDRLFITPPSPLKNTEWQLVNAEYFIPDKDKYNLRENTAVVLDFEKKRILICGTLYGGEMKKCLFSVLNYLMVDQDVLPMHCAANRDKEGESRSTSLFFGLSGTGKTTLSAEPHRLLIGDDEHGWGSDGIFNFEGGCYAKCIRLSEDYEPLIWNAIRSGTILENVVINPGTTPDYNDGSITENTRAAYPLTFIPEREKGNIHPHPLSVVFLTCDLFGVLPPVSRLTEEQIVYYFLSGYTALVGNTEVGHTQAIQPTFSVCFGAPFFPRAPQVYADLLMKRIRETNAHVYLVNTGWYGGAYGQGGERFPIAATREIIRAITTGQIQNAEFVPFYPFNLMIPKALGEIDPVILDPKKSWSDAAEYDLNTEKLLELFEQNSREKGFFRFLRDGPYV